MGFLDTMTDEEKMRLEEALEAWYQAEKRVARMARAEHDARFPKAASVDNELWRVLHRIRLPKTAPSSSGPADPTFELMRRVRSDVHQRPFKW